VILSLQLPFAVIPLVQFTNDRGRMGEFANAAWVRVLSWGATALILGLNIWLACQVIADWLAGAGFLGLLVQGAQAPAETDANRNQHGQRSYMVQDERVERADNVDCARRSEVEPDKLHQGIRIEPPPEPGQEPSQCEHWE